MILRGAPLSAAPAKVRTCAPIIAMATATPRPRSKSAALPTFRYTHLSSCLKAMRLTGEASNPFLAISAAAASAGSATFNRLGVIGLLLSATCNRLRGTASQSISLRGSWQCNRHGSIPYRQASRFRAIFQAVFSQFLQPCISGGWHCISIMTGLRRSIPLEYRPDRRGQRPRSCRLW